MSWKEGNRKLYCSKRKRELSVFCRHGYPVILIERRTLVDTLYQNLQSKDKVVLQKRLVQIEQTNNGVRAITKDGSEYAGDIIIGADGMHSSVRKVMHILGQNTSAPVHFDKDEYSSKSSDQPRSKDRRCD